jgi:hypothetical protein
LLWRGRAKGPASEARLRPSSRWRHDIA